MRRRWVGSLGSGANRRSHRQSNSGMASAGTVEEHLVEAAELHSAGYGPRCRIEGRRELLKRLRLVDVHSVYCGGENFGVIGDGRTTESVAALTTDLTVLSPAEPNL